MDIWIVNYPFWTSVVVTLSYCSSFAVKHAPNVQLSINMFGAGKAFSYFASQEAWIKEVLYHNVADDSPVCLLKTTCTPSQRLSHEPHRLWVCLEKKTGAVRRAYCTCMAGLVISE